MSRTPSWRKALPAPVDGKGNLRVYGKYNLHGLVVEVVLDYKDLPQGVVRKILQVVKEAKPDVHVLSFGVVACGRRDLLGLPKDWPEGHVWVSILDSKAATCQGCVEAVALALQKPVDRGT